MKVLVSIMLALLFLTGSVCIRPSYAQMDPWQLKLETERRERLLNEKTYNETMKRIGSTGAVPKKDPWSKMRKDEPTPEPKR
jgi:hypothetical protein